MGSRTGKFTAILSGFSTISITRGKIFRQAKFFCGMNTGIGAETKPPYKTAAPDSPIKMIFVIA